MKPKTANVQVQDFRVYQFGINDEDSSAIYKFMMNVAIPLGIKYDQHHIKKDCVTYSGKIRFTVYIPISKPDKKRYGIKIGRVMDEIEVLIESFNKEGAGK